MHTGLIVEMAAEGLSDRVAIGAATDGVTYADLLAQAQSAATQIAGSGAQIVAFVGENGLSFPLALFASGLAGCPFAPLNYRLPDVDLRKLLARTAPSLAIVDEAMIPRVLGVEGVTIVSSKNFVAMATSAPEAFEAREPDIAVLLFTSGTTGEPKAAILRHRHLTSYVISTVEFQGSGAEECGIVTVPPYHIAAVSAVLTSVYSGRRIVQLPAFSPEEWVRLVREEKVTHAMLVPTMLGRILDVLENELAGLPSLRAISYGGGRMPAQLIERALARLPHVDFVNAYGLTETSSTISVLDAEDHRAAVASDNPSVRRRLASVGRPIPGLEVSIRTPAQTEAEVGEPGEIWVRGEQVSGEYVGRIAIRSDGWFPTNDCGWMDEDGYLYVDGRLDDVIVRGGENISPGEIEDVLRTHPDVVDVAVIGMPDNDWGERVAAVIVSAGSPDPDALRAWTRSRLRSTKSPEDIYFRNALPYTETGKLLRRTLKQEIALSLEAAGS